MIEESDLLAKLSRTRPTVDYCSFNSVITSKSLGQYCISIDVEDLRDPIALCTSGKIHAFEFNDRGDKVVTLVEDSYGPYFLFWACRHNPEKFEYVPMAPIHGSFDHHFALSNDGTLFVAHHHLLPYVSVWRSNGYAWQMEDCSLKVQTLKAVQWCPDNFLYLTDETGTYVYGPKQKGWWKKRTVWMPHW